MKCENLISNCEKCEFSKEPSSFDTVSENIGEYNKKPPYV
jgi:hypothetical protein